MNISRDLFLLSAVAFQQGDYDKAASLYASSLSSSDAGDFLAGVDKMGVSGHSVSTSSSIAKTLSSSMRAAAALSSDLDEDEDLESDDDDPSNPGERIIPSSLSGVTSAVKVKS